MAVTTLGRLQYVEPTSFFKEVDSNGNPAHGTLSDAINFPYEDYNIGVDLSVRVTNRYSCGFGLDTNEYFDLNYSSDKGSITFLGGKSYGENSYLTTTFTDVSMTEPETNTSECLGVESISISYDSWMYPMVVIKFVDVRGASVMMPAERGYYNPSDMGANSALYKALFTFPYPIFTLKVKGLYGKGATYKLAVQKTSMEFDSNTGNFNITATFIGYMFGIFADIPMTYLAIAPYMPSGEIYWKDKIKDGTFRFRDANGNVGSEMLRIPELNLKLARAAQSEEAVSAAAAGQDELKNLQEQIDQLNDLISSYPFKDWYYERKNGYVYNIGDTYSSYDTLSVASKTFIENVKKYDEVYSRGYLGRFREIKSFSERGWTGNDIIRFISVVPGKDSNGNIVKGGPEYTYASDRRNKRNYDCLIAGYKGVQQYIETNRNKNDFCVFALYQGLTNIGENGYNSVLEDMSEEIRQLREQKKAAENEFLRKQTSIIEKAIGFRPSIKNIYDLMFAHMDTFMHCFYERMMNIKFQLESDKAKRAKSHYNIGNGATDTEDVKSNDDNGKQSRSQYLPPFAAFYENGNAVTQNQQTLMWPEKLVNGKDLEEVAFVRDLLSAAQLYHKNAEDAGRAIENLNSSEGKSKTSNIDGSPTPTVGQFIPLTAYDIIYKDIVRNPYDSARAMAMSGDKNLEGTILGKFALRSFYYLACNNSQEYAKAFGAIEAINLYKAIGDDTSREFYSFIKKYADGKSKGDDISNYVNEITTEKSDGITGLWQSERALNLNKSLFKRSGSGNLSYNLHKPITFKKDELTKISGISYVTKTLSAGNKPTEVSVAAEPDIAYQFYPLETYSFDKLKESYTSGMHLMNDLDFINTIRCGLTQENPLNSKATFKFWESRDYLRELYQSMKDEIERAKTSFESRTKDDDSERNFDEYGKLVDESSILNTYNNSLGTVLDDKTYDIRAIVDADEYNLADGVKLREVLTGKTYNEQNEYYIKYPTFVNENYDKSLFAEGIYNGQDSIEAKAYLFLQALPIKGRAKHGGIEEKNETGVALKARLLREGSYYWRMDNPQGIKVKIKDKDGNILSYKNPGLDETFCGDKYWTGDYETLNPILEGREGKYPKWSEPYGITESRKRILKNYFIEWANSTDDTEGFAANEARLRNTKLYNKGKYASGLNIKELVANDEKQSEEAKEGRRLQAFLRNLYFTICTTVELYSGINGSDGTNFTVSEQNVETAFEYFMKELENIYGLQAKMSTGDYSKISSAADVKNPFKNEDVLLSTYMTLKSLYDKWLCSPYKGPLDTWTLTRRSDSVSDFDNFIYADTFYRNIGYLLTVNISKVSSWLSSCLPTSNMNTTEGVLGYMGKSLYEFLTETAQDCGGMLLAMPQKFGLCNDVEKMFKPLSINDGWDEDCSSFVFMYTYKPSEHLGDTDTGNIDMNGWAPQGDGFSLTDEVITGRLFDEDKSGYYVPAFGVTYAKQNQAIFKNITLQTETHGVTEAGIAATMNIASKASNSQRETTLYGQDLYRVYSQYSYECGVETMGNIQIMPMMYFQLNNIPLWKGAYMIKNVSHEIVAGNMTTRFQGVRVNKYAIPMSDSALVVAKDLGTQGGQDSSNDDSTNDSSFNDNNETNYTTGMGTVNIKGNPKKVITDPIDFNEKNITNQKPIICLTPAHGPNTIKKREWLWSTKMIDKYLIPELRRYKFKDGTSYADNIQRCNKDGNHTGKGYSMIETKNLIEKYGSENVISVVPHWNGGGGQRHETYVNKTEATTRKDSLKLAECMQTAMEEVAKRGRNGDFVDMPLNAMKGPCKVAHLGESNTDGAPQQNCACILTENWYADYPYGSKWDNDNLYNKKDANGRYASMRGWFMDKGCEIIAKAHAEGIRRYIDSL